MTMVNNVIGMVNYVIAARPSLLNFMIADTRGSAAAGYGISGAGFFRFYITRPSR
jgi:hypothetical protein